jgi:hypothetical protein
MRQSYKKQLYCSKRAEKAKFAHQILKMKAYHIGNHNKDNAEFTTTGQDSTGFIQDFRCRNLFA